MTAFRKALASYPLSASSIAPSGKSLINSAAEASERQLATLQAHPGTNFSSVCSRPPAQRSIRLKPPEERLAIRKLAPCLFVRIRGRLERGDPRARCRGEKLCTGDPTGLISGEDGFLLLMGHSRFSVLALRTKHRSGSYGCLQPTAQRKKKPPLANEAVVAFVASAIAPSQMQPRSTQARRRGRRPLLKSLIQRNLRSALVERRRDDPHALDRAVGALLLDDLTLIEAVVRPVCVFLVADA
jgi:hypothetical protein